MTEEQRNSGPGASGASVRRRLALEWGVAIVVAALMVAIFFWPRRPAPTAAPVSRLPIEAPAPSADEPELLIPHELQGKEDVVRETVKLAAVLDQDPDNFEAHVQLAYRLKDLGYLDRAEAEFERALELRADAGAWIGLGLLEIERGDGDEAARAFGEAVKLDPDSAVANFDLCIALVKAKKTDEAITACRRAVDLNPGNVEAKRQLETAYSEAGRNAEP